MRVQGPGTNEFKQNYCSKAFKLVPRPLDEGARPKFASNQSKLDPRKLDPGPKSKVGLSGHLGCFYTKPFFSFLFFLKNLYLYFYFYF
jgi:hypothetical protein